MRSLAIVAAAVLALAGAGCQTLDARVQENLPHICHRAAQAHQAFLLASLTGHVSPRTAAIEAAAWRSLQGPCADPENADTASVLIAAVSAAAAINAALAEAERG